MSQAARLAPEAAAAADLSACDREPIHTPGHIQPHGVMVACAPGEMVISHISANFEESTGLRAADFLGGGLAALAGPAAVSAMRQMLDDAGHAPANAQLMTLPLPIQPVRQVLAHRWQNRMFVELEMPPGTDTAANALSRAQGIISSLGEARGVTELCALMARQVRGLTGFDRVMVYQFDEAGHGRVVAECKQDGLPPYLHLRYPASDIPAQARRLYVLNRVRAIPDTGYRPVPLLTDEAAALDMSFCALRGTSPVHLEYLANMGVRASASISIVRDDALWGMIVCHHMTPRTISADLRALCDVIGQFMSVMLLRVAETEALAERLGRFGAITILRNEMDQAADIAGGLCARPEVLLGLMDASGAVLRLGGEVRLLGAAPPAPEAVAMMDKILRDDGETIRHASDAAVAGGAAAGFAAVASGILVMPLQDHRGDAIAWFRPEVNRTVTWAGDPNKPVLAAGERLSPRKSFAAWSELVRGTSAPWGSADVQAAEDLRRVIMRARLRQAETALARLAAHDSLTGLANRRAIEADLKRWQLDGAPAEAALLFLDLDRFKVINDTLGHEAGDECLVQMAARLRHMGRGAAAGRGLRRGMRAAVPVARAAVLSGRQRRGRLRRDRGVPQHHAGGRCRDVRGEAARRRPRRGVRAGAARRGTDQYADRAGFVPRAGDRRIGVALSAAGACRRPPAARF
jgi:light-regulated signal transduction histidine kinase (bacteriophytochrome)